MKNKDLIIMHLLIGALFVFMMIMVHYEVKAAIEEYNDGICLNCGGNYHLAGVYHVKNSGDYYIYECENCHHTFKSPGPRG